MTSLVSQVNWPTIRADTTETLGPRVQPDPSLIRVEASGLGLGPITQYACHYFKKMGKRLLQKIRIYAHLFLNLETDIDFSHWLNIASLHEVVAPTACSKTISNPLMQHSIGLDASYCTSKALDMAEQ